MTLLLKSCPRCNGDLVVDNDAYGAFLQCLQCSYLRDMPEQSSDKKDRVEAAKEMVPVCSGSATESDL